MTATSAACRAGESATLGVKFDLSSWQLCWTVDKHTGLSLSDVAYRIGEDKPIPILKEAALAQIDVPYDDGAHEHLDLPGMGTLTLKSSIRPKDCSGGTLFAAPVTRSRKILCARVINAGDRYAWDDYDFVTGTHTRPGYCLDVSTLTPEDWYSYLNDWQFCDDGSIRIQVGASGTLAPSPEGYATTDGDTSPIGTGDTRNALDHYHNVFWRLEPDLGGTTNTVGEFDTTGTSIRTTTATPFTSETERTTAPNRAWYFQSTKTNTDDHPLRYDVDLYNADPYRGVPGHEYDDYDFYATQNRSCEILAANNQYVGCGAQLPDFVNGEQLSDPVIWTQTGFHHMPRDEDEPIMDEHWQGFSLVPRDLTATNPLAKGK